jgi:uncharacterized protein (TIGR02594 family)
LKASLHADPFGFSKWIVAMKLKRIKTGRKTAKRKPKKAGGARRADIAPVAIAAAIALATFGGFAAWPRLADVTRPVVARMDDEAFTREIDRAIAEARLPDLGEPLFAVPAQVAKADIAIRIDPSIAARAEAQARAATAHRAQPSRSSAHRRTEHRARQHANARRQDRVARSRQGLDAMAAVSSNELIAEARKYLGGNPTGWDSEWCGKFLDMILKKTGHKGGGNLARGYINYGKRLAGPEVGAIAVFSRKGGGHVGIVTGIDSNGNPIIISGNHNDRVAIATYPASRALAYVRPE